VTDSVPLPAQGSPAWYTWAEEQEALTDLIGTKAPLTGVEGVKLHDGTAGGGTRPSGFFRVRWIGGTARPTNMVTGDIWEHDA
jgi:hypothetical protein